MPIPLPRPKIYVVTLTLEEVYALGILLDIAPIMQQPIEGVLEGIFDKIDPILCDEYGNYWDAH